MEAHMTSAIVPFLPLPDLVPSGMTELKEAGNDWTEWLFVNLLLNPMSPVLADFLFPGSCL